MSDAALTAVFWIILIGAALVAVAMVAVWLAVSALPWLLVTMVVARTAGYPRWRGVALLLAVIGFPLAGLWLHRATLDCVVGVLSGG